MSHCGCIIESDGMNEKKKEREQSPKLLSAEFVYLLVSFSNKTGSIGSCATFRSESPSVCLKWHAKDFYLFSAIIYASIVVTSIVVLRVPL